MLPKLGAGVSYLSLSRDTVPEGILQKKVKEDLTLRSSRDGHPSSSNISSTLLLLRHRCKSTWLLSSALSPPFLFQFHFRDAK